MSNHTTAAEIGELVRRTKTLLHRQGVEVQGIHSEVIRYAEFHGVCIKHFHEGRIVVEDGVAGVITFNNDSEGISQVFGGTALKALKTLRENMVLDDLADA